TEGLSGLSGERNPLLGGTTEGLPGLSGERSPLGGTTEGLPGLSGERIPLLGGTTEGLSGLSGEGTPLLGDTTPGLLGLSGDRTLSIGSANQNQQSLMTTHQPRSNEYGSQSTSEKSTGGVKERDKNKENSSSELVSQTLQGSKDKKSYPRELMRVYPVALFLFLATITIISISYYNTKLEKKSEK
ncbi:hypothetical protein ABID29_002310, partial [Streptococcus rupicaprae]